MGQDELVLYEWLSDPREELAGIDDENERAKMRSEFTRQAIMEYSSQRRANRQYQESLPTQYDYCVCTG